MRPCPHCAQPIKDDAQICKWCSRSVLVPTNEELRAERERTLEQARAAHAAGTRLFQIALPLSETIGLAPELRPQILIE
jgi:hypothetical protein